MCSDVCILEEIRLEKEGIFHSGHMGYLLSLAFSITI